MSDPLRTGLSCGPKGSFEKATHAGDGHNMLKLEATERLIVMLGWMLVFALILPCGAISCMEGAVLLGVVSSLVFGFLLLVSAFSWLLRGTA